MRSLKSIRLLLLGLVFTGVALMGACPGFGLNFNALLELSAAGVDKYIGEFTPISSTDVGDGWTKHTFDPDGGNGPICIAGTPYSVFTRAGNPDLRAGRRRLLAGLLQLQHPRRRPGAAPACGGNLGFRLARQPVRQLLDPLHAVL